MAIFKCKMCGGALEIQQGATVVTCDYCGTQQTLPKLDDERRANLYDRANHFRRNNDFDKAMGIYEQILNEQPTDAEAYWSLVLCKYGIEYVEDPTSHKRIPTVNRAQFTSVFDDDDYKSAINHADMQQRTLYEAEAKTINEIQKGILAISQKEEPFDVFICYKETDSHGHRTHDSVLANDLYHQLTQEGFKVFFSRITLEDKLGTAYEPYIFAALNSAKVMVVLGTKPEYFKAVWVKNEWSRYLALVKNSKGKKVLIPAYKDMDPYDLPEEFSHLQAQDMSKLGFMQDLIRGIKKLATKDTPVQTVVKEPIIVKKPVSSASSEIAPLLKRGFIYLEDKDWSKANEYFERVLDMDPECAEAYLGKLMAELHVSQQSDLRNCAQPFDGNYNYSKVIRYGDKKLVDEIKGYINFISERNENRRLAALYGEGQSLMRSGTVESYRKAAVIFGGIQHYKDSSSLMKECARCADEIIYNESVELMKKAVSSKQYIVAQNSFLKVIGYKDAKSLSEECQRLSEEKRLEEIYQEAVHLQQFNIISDVLRAKEKFLTIRDYKDSAERIEQCIEKIKELEKQNELKKQEIAEQRALEEKRNKTANKIWTIAVIAVFVVFVFVMLIAAGIFDSDSKFNYSRNDDGSFTIEAVKNKDVTTVVIPSKFRGKPVTGIGDNAFEGCKNLTNVTIPNSVTSIGDRAFMGCENLKDITIPSSVTIIKYAAFRDCTSLESITLPFVGNTPNGTTLTHFGFIFGATKVGENDDEVPTSLKTVIITGGTSIDDYAFAYCYNLTSITISDSVTSIGEWAFRKCGLTSITIPGSVQSIGEYAFYECTKLKNVTIENGVESIGSRAFVACALSNITIPYSVTSIGKGAFGDCANLTKVTFVDSWIWYVAQKEYATSGTSLTLTNSSTNATYLTDTYLYYYWYKN